MAANKNFFISTSSHAYGTTGNWTDGTPDAGDSVSLENSNIDIDGSDQTAAALASFVQMDTYSGMVGNFTLNNGTSGTPLQIDTAILVLGRRLFPGARNYGSPRMLIGLGSTTACVAVVESTCDQSADQGFPPVRITGGKSTSTLEVWSGNVGVAMGRSDETASFAVITVGRAGNGADTFPGLCQYTGGIGITLATRYDIVNGVASVYHAFPAANVYGGQLVHYAGAVSGTITVYKGGIYVPKQTGTIAQITVKEGGFVDFSQSNATIAVTNMTVDNRNGFIPNSRVNFGNPVAYTGRAA